MPGPTPITFTEKENEWLQNVLLYFYNNITFIRNDTETALYNSILAKLKAGDTV